MDNITKELERLHAAIPNTFINAIKTASNTKVVEHNISGIRHSTFISTDTIKADCELLAILQSAFINVNFIFAKERDITPFIHLFKDTDEGVALFLNRDAELLTEEEFEEMQSFSIDERIEILITSIKSRLAKIGASKENRYVICYGGSDTLKDEYSTFLNPKLVHRLSILEIKY